MDQGKIGLDRLQVTVSSCRTAAVANQHGVLVDESSPLDSWFRG